jgi:hypothetical protein
MEIQYQLTEQDFRESMYAHRRSRAFTRWFYRGLIAIILVAFGFILLALFGAAIEHNAKLALNLLPLMVLLVAWAALIWIVPYWMARSQFRKQPAARSVRSVTIDDLGLRSHWDSGNAETAWKNYIRLFESKNEILLYSSPALFNILPKRAFTSEQLEQFRTLAKEKIALSK